MRRTRWTTVLACFAGPAVLAWAASDLMLRHRGWAVSLTPWGAAVAVAIAAIVLLAGLAVRRLREHEPTWMTPTGAALTAAAAQASSRVGAVVGGVYGGGLVVALMHLNSPAMTALAWSAAACLAACVLWIGVGLIVEHWCAIGEDDDDDLHTGSSPSGSAA
ncbi:MULTISPECIES: DUF3180 family protein [unclassified Actinomyces]|uniref:DUF3180 family protein n=1 Tax=unclassified Actinomyces TaxID=2609248 RepID=UPI000D58DAC2|nr:MULTISPECIES: DUF3180 family protein [unclassified Actinomyces]RAX19811.1 DUF3180 family protein [Actinomyces sp. Z5]RAX20156.1 DUF3180 family protein [Actinomyces sp. Z3]